MTVITYLKNRKEKIHFPFYTLKGDKLVFDGSKKTITFGGSRTFKDREELENFVNGLVKQAKELENE